MKKTIIILGLLGILVYVIVSGNRFRHNDIYLLSLNGKVENIRVDIKERMYITVSNKEHDLAHYWPELQKKIRVGDSVYKDSKDYDIVLIKANDNKRVICKLREK
ncbi:hypothetical protein KXQ82_10390 [Mucilaginibacter sp. HMF5004]|uniref:hypothetical protein n=1 Tax=Mucilaginibacter rivuli TaxID=2857527 RepID=UPI001C5F1FF2|nr:hypothetical protein [Mucilaginibacter rivuli]MBW4890127.1 hypothetical protein [Mucilaginibacter rivuli]